MTAEEVRTHLRYTGWASRRLLDAATKLSDEERNRDLRVSHKSVWATLAHIHFGDRIWFSRVVDPAIEVYRISGLPPDGSLAEKWAEIQWRWEQWADSLIDRDLTRVVSYKTWEGISFENPLWQIMMHVVNHATLHRGQVMAMLRQLGVQPPPTDLIFYYREQSTSP